MRASIEWEFHGLVAYGDALRLQEARWQSRRSGGRDVCLALEHPSTVTLGRRATVGDLLLPSEGLAARGIACVQTERGGGATYHGPGQLVLYPIIDLAARGFGVREMVWRLEQIMIEVAESVGVRATRDPSGRGVWTSRGKLGAVGLRVRDGISTHGLALNVANDLQPFSLIAPCSVPDLAVTRLVDEGDPCATVENILPATQRASERWLTGGVRLDRERAAEDCSF